jgi:glycosyltransferase involved in cell wall biosynthesis
MPSLSVIVNTLNEEANIADCLASVKDLADEIVVVDMHSDDRTVEIAKSHGAKVFQYERVGYVEPARNFAFTKATCDWLLVLDADERVLPGLADTIRQTMAKPEAEIYYLPRKNLLLGRWMEHALWWPDYQMRLWKRGKVQWPNEVHGIPKTTEPTANIESDPKAAIEHHAYDTISEFVSMINSYTNHEVRALEEAHYSFRRRHVIVHPLKEFWRRYFKTGGYKDGFDGLMLAFLLMCYKGVAVLKYWEKHGPRDFHDRNQSAVKAISKIVADR